MKDYKYKEARKRAKDKWNKSEKGKAYMKQYLKKYRQTDKYKAYAASEHRQYRSWATALKRNYGITPDDYYTMFEQQKGCCAICGNPARAKKDNIPYRLAVDHDHVSGKVRGLLCMKCNQHLGWHEKYYRNINNYLDSIAKG